MLKTHLNQNKQLYNQRQAIDPANEEAYSTNELAIKEQLWSVDSILQVHNSQIENRKNELFAQIGNIQTSDEFEENHKKILKIQYKLIDNDISDLENYEWNILASIANKCGYEYGQPVYIARNLIYEDGGLRPDLYNDEFLCTEISERNSSSFVTAFPNPAQDQITVTLKDGHNFARIVIKDINNKNITQKSIGSSTESIDLNLSEYFSGIYFIYLSNSNSKEFEVLKIIKI